jgi:predicted phosphodiesterase/transposase-like protein
MSPFWTKERLDVLKAYLEGGLSYSEIALKFKVSSDSIGKTVKRYSLSKFRKVDKDVPVLDLEELNDENFEEQKEAAKLQWKIPTTKLTANPNNKFKQIIIIGDVHAPEQDDTAIKSVLNLMDDIKFDGIINLGDYLNLSCISHWNKEKRKTLEGKRLKSDFIVGCGLLDEFDKRLPKGAEKHFLKGNHEEWLDQLVETQPALEGLFDLETGLKLTERGYKVYPYNEIVRFGRLCITHGIYCGTTPARTHASKLLSNVLVGHTHSPEMCLIHSPAKEVSVVGYVNGCLCHMSPDYMKSKPSNWATGVAILYLFPNGWFDVNLIRIVKGRFVYNEKLYDGNR